MTNNPFKQKLASGNPQFGMFCMSVTAQATDLLSDSGFDFLIFDMEHSPSSVPILYSQVLALARTTTHVMVRMPSHDPVLLKPILDMGIDTVMIPNVRNAAEGRAMVEAVRFPPHGIRGVGGSVRATRYGRDQTYYAGAADRTCLVLQVESEEGLKNIEDICSVEGVDGVFIGPVDLATDMGYLASPTHEAVITAALDGVRRARAAGKAAGIMTGEAQCQQYLDAGANLVCLGSDLGLLARTADALASRWVKTIHR